MDTLISYGADVNSAGRNQLPPLHLAAMCGNVDLIERLIANGAALHATDFVHFTALHCATYSAHDKV